MRVFGGYRQALGLEGRFIEVLGGAIGRPKGRLWRL